ncbi:MAG TPA: GNAT family N-acetyltransferase [Anaerolineales bacterium]|nr:GNAT family N-acetyltransferase [Anaerolineales bacterium]
MENVIGKEYLRELGDGLVLRRSTPADAEALEKFNAEIHGNPETGSPDVRVGVWTRDLLERPHPTFNHGDFTIVEDSGTGEIVSSLNLISQVWTYEDVAFKVGRPELVGTRPEYRNRGLVRAQFELIHEWSAARGEQVQAITGIPYFYRLFGYEMALDLGGERLGYLPQVPKLKKDEQEPFSVRPAGLEDVAFISEVYQYGCKRSLISCTYDQALWCYELEGKSPDSVNRSALGVIESLQGEPVGFLAHPPFNWAHGASMVATLVELKSGVSWAEVAPSLVRYLKATGETNASKEGKEPFGAFGFWLGSQHPIYEVLHDRLPRVRKPYAWYLRVPDLPGFLRLLTPVLERRLGESIMADHTGDLKLTFYQRGLWFSFDKGHITRLESWRPEPTGNSGDAAFPGLSFLQLLFGYRSLDELDYAFPDCWWESGEARALLNVLFPKRPSNIWPVS